MRVSAPFLGFLAGAILAWGPGLASAQLIKSPGRQPAPRTGEVYLLRGLANVFSTGLDTLGGELREKGVLNTRVHNHTLWKGLAEDVLRRARAGTLSYPLIIMGHSYGADACAQMATYLGEHGVPVTYAVTFDPSHNGYAGRNIARFVNYYVSTLEGPASNNVILKGPGFNGSLDNVNVAKRPDLGHIVHLNVEKNPRLHEIIVRNVVNLTKPAASR